MTNDLLNNDLIKNKCKSSLIYSQNLYAALCNNEFVSGNKRWSCSWRESGNLVAKIRNCGEDYLNWYCSGMSGNIGYKNEGFITEEISLDLMKLGWTVKRSNAIIM